MGRVARRAAGRVFARLYVDLYAQSLPRVLWPHSTRTCLGVPVSAGSG